MATREMKTADKKRVGRDEKKTQFTVDERGIGKMRNWWIRRRRERIPEEFILNFKEPSLFNNLTFIN